MSGRRARRRRRAAARADDVEDALERDRLEVEAVGGVVVGRDRLRVRVQHHRLVAEPPEGLRRADAAVVELDPGPIRFGPEPSTRIASRGVRLDLVAALVREVEVRRLRLELGGARVDREPAGCRRPSGLSGARTAGSPETAAASGRPKRFAAARSPSRSKRAIAAWIDAISSWKYGCASGNSGIANGRSRPSTALRSASGNVRPSPSDSPTAFISVPSAGGRRRTSRSRSAAPSPRRSRAPARTPRSSSR